MLGMPLTTLVSRRNLETVRVACLRLSQLLRQWSCVDLSCDRLLEPRVDFPGWLVSRDGHYDLFPLRAGLFPRLLSHNQERGCTARCGDSTCFVQLSERKCRSSCQVVAVLRYITLRLHAFASDSCSPFLYLSWPSMASRVLTT